MKISSVMFMYGGIILVAVLVMGMSPENTRALTPQVEALTQINQQLATRNQELQETLKLAKQQIQANRVVYQDLLERVNSSDAERNELRKQLANQRVLLQDLREKRTDS